MSILSSSKEKIPILGKFVPKKLNGNEVKGINILLDEDRQQQALQYTMVMITNQGISTKNIVPSDRKSDMGFSEVNSKLKESTKTDFSDIISQKLKGL